MSADHVIVATMMDEWNEALVNVCVCSCGAVFRVPRDGGGLAGALKREDEMTALIEAHKSEVMGGLSWGRKNRAR